MATLLPAFDGRAPEDKPEAGERVSEAFYGGTESDRRPRPGDAEPEDTEPDATRTFSAREVLQHADFETMTVEELAQAKAMIARLRLPIPEVRTRRFRRDDEGARVDLRASLRASLRAGSEIIPLKRRSVRYRHPPLVVLCCLALFLALKPSVFVHHWSKVEIGRAAKLSHSIG